MPIKTLVSNIPLHIWVGLSNWASRIITISIQLISIPILAHNLTTEQYAAYTIAVSLLGWFALADLGMGASLQNFLAEAAANKKGFSEKVATVAAVATISIFIGLLLIFFLAPVLGSLLFKGKSFGSNLPTQIFLTAGSLFLLTAIGSISNRMLYGIGQGYLANLLTAISSVASLVLLLNSIDRFQGDKLLLATLLSYGAPLALSGILTGIVLAKKFGTLEPTLIRNNIPIIARRAQGFFLISLFATGVLNVDYFVMSQTIGPEQITTYNILSRYFGLAITLYGGILAATSVHWSQLIERKDWKKFKSSWKTHIAISCGGFLAIFTIVGFAATPLLHLLAPKLKDFSVQTSTLLLFGAYIVIRLWTDTSTIALQSANETKTLVRWIPIQALISIACQIFFANKFGINGIIIGLIVSFLATVAWALPMKLKQITTI